MSVTYASPGVYVQEITPTAIQPIQAVGTSLPAFIGITKEASLKKVNPRTGDRKSIRAVLNEPVLVDTWTRFVEIFGGFSEGAYLPDSVYHYFSNGGGPCYVVSLQATEEADAAGETASTKIPGKSRDSFTVTAKSVGEGGNSLTIVIANELDDKGKASGAFSVTVGREKLTGLTMKKSDDKHIGKAEFSAVTITAVGPASAPPNEGSYQLGGGGSSPLTAADFIGDALTRTGIAGLEAMEEVRLIACPDLVAGYDGSDDAKLRIKAVQTEMVHHCERMRYRFAILDTPPGLNAQEAREWRQYLGLDSSYGAVYYPWVEIPDLNSRGSKLIPPSGPVTGVYNRVDADRGVHKAPANEVVNGVIGLETQLSRGEQDLLNPIGVNCIRAFPNRGIRIWGARTLDSNGAWRYISVRRLFIMIAASMDAGLQWAVFEPNDGRLWSRINRDVTGFLRNVWRSGGLFGDSEEQAFYVKCDAELNTEEVRDMGQLIIEVGVAPVKPAEFVIFRLTQWSGMAAADDEGEEEGGESGGGESESGGEE